MFLRVGAMRAGVVLAAAMLLATPVAAQRSAAESIADKFSADDAAAQRKAEEQRKKEAEAKAMEALREQARKRAEEALKAERARHKPASKPPAPQTPPTVPAAAPVPVDPKAEEDDMLARARLEEAARVKAQQEAEASRTIEKIIAERTAKTEEAAQAQARAKIVADARRAWQRSAQRIAAHEKDVAEAQARAKTIADARRAWQRSAQRIAAHEKDVAEAQARADAMAEAARAEAERKAAVFTQPATPPPAAEAPRAPTPAVSDALRNRVTVLLIMQPGNKGIRRHNKSADPILCVNGGCYVSRGAEAPAQFMPGRQALGLANTWGGRAGACRNQLGCVFRSVAVADLPLLIQPVDLRVVKHDRRHMAAVSTDSHCRLDAGRLACARGVVEDDYVMWVIPEALAESAGPAVLDRAVTAGLTGTQSAHVGGR